MKKIRVRVESSTTWTEEIAVPTWDNLYDIFQSLGNPLNSEFAVLEYESHRVKFYYQWKAEAEEFSEFIDEIYEMIN